MNGIADDGFATEPVSDEDNVANFAAGEMVGVDATEEDCDPPTVNAEDEEEDSGV